MICLGWSKPQVSPLTVSENKMERRKWRKGMQGQSEIESMGKCWLRSATGLCAVTYLSACRDIKTHSSPDAKVLCWAGCVQAPENLIIWCLPASSQDIWTQRITVILPLLELRKLVFLAVTRIQLVGQAVLLRPCDAHTLSWWCAWLLICTAVDFFRKVARLCCSPGNCQLPPS